MPPIDAMNVKANMPAAPNALDLACASSSIPAIRNGCVDKSVPISSCNVRRWIRQMKKYNVGKGATERKIKLAPKIKKWKKHSFPSNSSVISEPR